MYLYGLAHFKSIIVIIDRCFCYNAVVARFRLRARSVPGSKPDFTEDPCMGPLHIKSYVGDQTSSHWCSVDVWRGAAISGAVLII
ncbi:hypothetical protein AVEN_73085-1 [Araneus ventricosus]|uniref:Uncharacterized protein n=1 Tax=Araneus ventricosus TaxID=182803 RepID=A0A4Y2J1N4_ARAVE|nr:hypothetical protein AVEN_73085-1 [Araneus ventricosus]